MLIGIDVGGTFTDGVLFDGKTIIASVKQPTDKQDLKITLLTVLDDLLQASQGGVIQRIVFSTTLVTNLLATESGDKTALLLMPGSGLPLDSYLFFPYTFFLKGSIDFRGRLLEKVDPVEVEKAVEAIKAKGINRIAVVCKFSNRNNTLEREVRRIILAIDPQMQVTIGSETAGQLNFRRRIVTTYYSAMTQSAWESFSKEIEASLAARNIQATIDILKADGGTMSLPVSRSKPCETIFSGPAASTMGAIALTMNPKNSVVLDIGGTTVDISLLIEGRPLYASKGATIKGQYTHINAFSVRSIALGGDNPIDVADGVIKLETMRRGPAACLGGDYPTVTDVFNQKYNLSIGEPKHSQQKLADLIANTGIDMETLCQTVEDKVYDRIQDTIREMFLEWENEPAYRVWEVVNGRKFELKEIIGIGAASSAFVPGLAQRMQVDFRIPEYADVANALGACVSRPTLALQVHIDTQNRIYSIDQDGISDSIPNVRSFQIKDAKELAMQNLVEIAHKRGMESYADEAEFYLEEQFNMIRGWDTAGKIFEIGVQISPGFIQEYKGVSK
ncbi:MAG: hydantoinase/oxoprolinase family protein [Syntrophomonas sp.]|nr:hydantoinase/oxoprolinase family protein [Syntrophomonas sp.]